MKMRHGIAILLAGQERVSLAQEPATAATSTSGRSSWARTGRPVGEGAAEPHYKPGVPSPPKGALCIYDGLRCAWVLKLVDESHVRVGQGSMGRRQSLG